MDGKGRALDSIFIERLWWSVKYENVYMNVYENGLSLWSGLDPYFQFYNHERLNQSLEYHTPNQKYVSEANNENNYLASNAMKKLFSFYPTQITA